MSLRRVLHLLSAVFAACASLVAAPQNAKKSFTVADDIALSRFGDADYDRANAITFSPDGRYFVVDTQRGRLDLNSVESTVRVYRTEAVHRFLLNSNDSREPLPDWAFNRAAYKEGPSITNIVWLSDSSGISFLGKNAKGNDQLFLADLKTRTVSALTADAQHITSFDIRDRNHFVYTVLRHTIFEKIANQRKAVETVGTGLSIFTLLFPEESVAIHDLSELWAVVNGHRFRIDGKSTRPLRLHLSQGEQFSELALSPNGLFVVTTLAIETVPAEWETLYPPPFASDSTRIRAGHQDLDAFDGVDLISEYVLVDLSTGSVRPLTNAPAGLWAGWTSSQAAAAWSDDGVSVLLPNTFIRSQSLDKNQTSNRPCIAEVNVANGRVSCVDHVSGEEPDKRFITKVAFAPHSRSRVLVTANRANESVSEVTDYIRLENGRWAADSATSASVTRHRSIDVSVRQGLNSPPVLIATDETNKVSRVILDPNPQIKNIDLGEASVFKWKDKTGRERIGGLYKPSGYIKSIRYPVVIQTHGFTPDYFIPSGIFNTTFAARELAAAGIVVLQVSDCPIAVGATDEGLCNVAGYEAAVGQLVADGIADPDRVGIVGFSRTCYYVLRTLTTSSVHFKAASITDGVNVGYFQYILTVDHFNDAISHEADAVVGARPFGNGLQEWLKSSPTFNMDKLTAALQIVGIGPGSLLTQWEPYAALRYLGKPVDLIMLGGNQHILTNPKERMASQGGTVDWFRFWLKDEEDPDPDKAERYKRWRELRKPHQQDNVFEGPRS